MRSASEAVAAGAPSAKISTSCIDRMGAIFVVIYKCENGAKRKIYTTDQRNLFRKYPDRRSKAMAEITAIVRQEMGK
ncbi:hypothetical protein GUITHDRAFT_154374 [Guillardia theta CCMP2712]|uniref:Uncharacterized protein n=1 Tax=Guillardia theta (strain CCMP2712) TaxID=905079 RepID=L1IUH9_GUITC|nr:hypothetical protein GUITHDRAFT_154374 [Guillardia theta CCMP2712]EKX39554.1 hypothetical protein GUITHDRAFT_154374 [Guillardia theta CCMP2712]|eukprot:XP_005826534.1 hypothetical protein GUITHDRAFT_154374 [Guillardia theta CCMP2712]